MIEVAGLCKRYHSAATLRELVRGRLRGREQAALEGVDLAVAEGERLALMGDNGAGKTTLLRVLAGLTPPTSGRVTVAGLDAAEAGAALRRVVGVSLADERSFTSALSPLENLAFTGALHGFSRNAAIARAAELLARVGLADLDARRPIRELSTGMRQRVALARALLGDPRVLLLDEPTRAIDAPGRAALHNLLDETARGRTLVIATHDATEAERLGARVVRLAAGRLAPAEAAHS